MEIGRSFTVYCPPSSLCNLVSLGLLNNSGIFYDNENATLYRLGSNRVLAQARRWKNSYLLNLLNLSDAAIYLLKIDDKSANGHFMRFIRHHLILSPLQPNTNDSDIQTSYFSRPTCDV